MIKLYDEKLHKVLGVEVKIDFFYKDDDDLKNVLNQISHDECKMFLENDDDSWDYVDKGFGFDIDIALENPSSLFGPLGLVTEDAELGIALQWVSKQSYQRDIIPVTSITHKKKGKEHISINYYFSNKQLFGEVELSIILYLKKASVNSANGEAKLPGLVLGTLEYWSVILDGNGSIFPIVIIDEPQKPLWFVEFNYTDPLVEPFDKEYIKIYLNKAHIAFSSVDKPKNFVDQSLYIEFLAGAIQLILQNLMDCQDWQDIKDGRNCEESSIGQVMHYFKTTFNWNLDCPEKTAISLREDLERRVKLGEI